MGTVTQIGSEELTADLDRKAAATGIVAELIFTDLSDREVTGLGMGHHQTRDTGMRFHGTTLRQADANLFHIQQFIEDEVQTGIWQ